MVKYVTFGISITIISWIVGMFLNYALRKTEYHNRNLANLNFIRSEKANKLIGLGPFKWIVKNTFFKFFNQKLALKTRTGKPDLDKIRTEMTISEIDHLIGFVFVAIFAFVKVLDAKYLFALIIMAVNILMNLYPSLLQQENKRRIDRLLKKL
jgi:hypothetical protein